MSSPADETVRATIDELLAARREGATICPSEVARALRPDGDWRALMDQVRAVATDERDAGRLVITQGGEPADGPPFHGPLRLGRPG